MKRLAVLSLFALVIPAAASAADLPAQPVYKAPAVQAFSWTGCYVGGNVGWVGNDSTANIGFLPAFIPAQIDAGARSYGLTGSAATAGIQYGCNRQYGQVVIGLDSDFNWSGLSNSTTATYPDVAILIGRTETVTQKVDWFSTTRARLGWASDRWLLFVAGGLANGHVKSTYLATFPGNGAVFSASDTHNRYGWTIGAGVEYALSQNWFLRGEYLYVDLGKFNYSGSAPTFPTFAINTEVSTRFHVARAAISYRFTRTGSLLEWALDGFRY